MGLHHDRYQACEHNSDNPCPTSVKPYAYGYVNQELFDPRGSTTRDRDAPDSAIWRTIMAYLNQCRDAGVFRDCDPALLRFSNPNQVYPDPGGDPMGKSGTQTTNVVDGPADAARTLNETRTTVANFRQGRAVKVSFEAATYTATEGGTAATVKVQLDAAPGRAVIIPLTLDTTDAWTHDYTDVPDTVRFTATQTERTVTVTAVNDSFDENDETLTLAFGDTLPNGVTEGSQASTTVTLADDDTVAGAPSVETISITSDPGSDGIYLAGDEIEVAVVFTKTITVTGTPQLGLTLDGGVQQVDYQGGAGEVLVFTYTVADGDSAANGLSIAADSLTLNGGTIKDATDSGTSLDATLTHTVVAADSNHAVDGVTPTLQTAVVDGTEVTLTYDEALDETSKPAAGAFAVTAGGETLSVNSVAVDGAVVTLTLGAHAVGGQVVLLGYTPGRSPLQDPSGNAVDALTNEVVTNNTPETVYDTDADGLIEIENLAQLHAIRHDLDGDGIPADSKATEYATAFPNAGARLTCGVSSGCAGYELEADLDFDTDGDGQVDADDGYWNSGNGWQPIGTNFNNAFRATFAGNGHTIRHLFIKRNSASNVGLFGRTAAAAIIRHVGVVAAEVRGNSYVGGLAGINYGRITSSYVTGSVQGGLYVGGLAGGNRDTVHTSYATARVTGSQQDIGGLVGDNGGGTITASYATGSVSGTGRNSHNIGGLVGANEGIGGRGEIHTSYATGPVSGGSAVGGLIGLSTVSSAVITASYWDTRTSGRTNSARGTGQTTTALQTPTGYSGIYANWNVDLDGDGTDDDPWDFGTSSQYPVLKGLTGDWTAFGRQLREGPTLQTPDTATVGQVDLSWTAVATNHWSPAPTVIYTVTRDDTPLDDAEDLSTTTYTDTDVTSGSECHYQVVALVDGGEATRSARLAVTATANQKPTFDEGDSAMRSVDENTPTGQPIGDPVAATDIDDTTLAYSLGGTDAVSFDIVSTTGQLRTQAALNYEAKRRYTVTISVSDGKNNDGEADMATDDTITVTINVGNLDEAGTVTLSGTPARELHQLTVVLSDPDGTPSGTTWQWSRSAATTCPGTDLAGETAARYTPEADDVDQYLCATATYTDVDGIEKSVAAVTGRVAAAPVVTLHLSDASISEDGMESSTVMAALDTPSSAVTTVTVSTPADDIVQSGSTLTIAAEATTSTGTVTLKAKPNTVDGAGAQDGAGRWDKE